MMGSLEFRSISMGVLKMIKSSPITSNHKEDYVLFIKNSDISRKAYLTCLCNCQGTAIEYSKVY